MPITVKARDGQTDLYGLMFQPTKLDATRKYPIINFIYPGPQGGSVGSRSFSAAHVDHQALAELGFYRSRHRRHGESSTLEEIPRFLLRQHGRQYTPRPDQRHE